PGCSGLNRRARFGWARVDDNRRAREARRGCFDANLPGLLRGLAERHAQSVKGAASGFEQRGRPVGFVAAGVTVSKADEATGALATEEHLAGRRRYQASLTVGYLYDDDRKILAVGGNCETVGTKDKLRRRTCGFPLSNQLDLAVF